MATVPAEVQGPSDAELIDLVRKGTISAYGSLYERHVAAAYNLARQLSRSPAESDDLVSEAFAKVLDTLKAGRGPDSAFRAYLLTALRHTAYDKTRRDKKIELSDDVETVSGATVSMPFTDTAVAGLERSLAAQAFARLPERWQAVLWHTEIEGQSPAEVAPILGLTPNGVSALAYRAREGLKQAYLQVHLAQTTEQRCRTTADRLGAYTRDGLSKRERVQVEAHLDECERCRSLAAELMDVNGALRAMVAPLVLGSGTLGYLAAAKAAVVGGVVAAGAGAVAATCGGAAGGAASGGAAAGAAGSLPRQILGVTTSAAALAAAIAIGLASGGSNKEIPQAAQEPPPPTLVTPKPNPPVQPPPQSPTVPPPPPPNSPSPTQTPPPPPQAPNLTASPPAVPISLIAGGAPADVPITVANNGGSLSGPVSATLALPEGVTAIPSGPVRFGAAPLLSLSGPPSGTVFCPGGTKSVTCGTGTGLPPGGSVTLLFRVVAAADSPGGEITGTVSDGSTVHVSVTVRVVVKPPAERDGVSVRASAEWTDALLPGLLVRPLVEVTATNTGTSTKPITVTIDHAASKLVSTPRVTCAVDHFDRTTCTSTAPIGPGGTLRLSVKLTTRILHLCDDEAVKVTATLGTAKDTITAPLDCFLLPGLPQLPPHHPVAPPATPPPGIPKPPTKPHLQSPTVPLVPPTTPASPLPPVTTERPAAPPPPGKPVLPPLPSVLRWLLPG